MGAPRRPDARLGAARGGLHLSSPEQGRQQPRTRWLGFESNRGEWERLRAAIELCEAFTLIAVQVGDRGAARFVEELLREQGGELVTLTLGPHTRVSTVLEQLRARDDARIVWVELDDDFEGADAERLFSLLNQKRELISRAVAGALVLAMHPLDWASFRRAAPDFWSVHQAAFRFAPASRLPPPVAFASCPDDWGMTSIRASVPLPERSWRLSSEALRAGSSRPFVGREAGQRALVSTLSEPGARVVVLGASGVGKSALVGRALPQLSAHYPGGIWRLSLRAIGGAPVDPHGLLRGLLTELLELRSPSTARSCDLPARFHFVTRERACLFIYEDLDDPELLDWLTPGPGSSMVVTSSTPGAVPTRSFNLRLMLSELDVDAALELLAPLPEALDHQALAQRVRDPLSLRLLVASLSRAGLAATRDWSRTSASGRAPGSEDDVEDLWFMTLPPDCSELWPKLYLFETPFDQADAAAVSGRSWSARRCAAALDELVARAIIEPVGDGRYAAHGSLRAYADVLLSPLSSSRLAHLQRVLCERPWLPEDPDLQAASAWLQETTAALPEGSRGLDLDDFAGSILLAGLPRLVEAQAGSRELLELIRCVAEARGDQRTLARVYAWSAEQAQLRELEGETRRWRDRQLDASAAASGSEGPEFVQALIERGAVGRDPETLAIAARALDHATRLDDPRLIARASLVLGRLDADESATHYARALESSQRAADPELTHAARWGLGLSALARGELDQARAHFESHLDSCGPEAAARSYFMLGGVATRAGDYTSALTAYAKALVSDRDQGAIFGQISSLRRMGLVALQRGDRRSARHHYGEAAKLEVLVLEELGELDPLQAEIGLLEQALGDWLAAVDWLVDSYPELLESTLTRCYEATPDELRPQLRERWRRAGYGWRG